MIPWVAVNAEALCISAKLLAQHLGARPKRGFWDRTLTTDVYFANDKSKRGQLPAVSARKTSSTEMSVTVPQKSRSSRPHSPSPLELLKSRQMSEGLSSSLNSTQSSRTVTGVGEQVGEGEGTKGRTEVLRVDEAGEETRVERSGGCAFHISSNSAAQGSAAQGSAAQSKEIQKQVALPAPQICMQPSTGLRPPTRTHFSNDDLGEVRV